MLKSIKTLKKLLLIITASILSAVFFIPVDFYQANSLCLTIIAKDKIYEYSRAEIGIYNGKYYLKNAREIVDGIYLDTIKRSQDASVKFVPNTDEKFFYTNEVIGEEICKEDLLENISLSLNSGVKKIQAKFKKTYPKITVENVKNENNYRVRFTTYYNSSNDNRKHNIKLASCKINGYILDKNQEFSFNSVVGVRNEENGFLPAKIIFNGDYVEGVGGGVCQVSTTLYNVALLSGLKITEHHPHSLQVGYIEPSFDAMVNSYTSDLKFINNTGAKIYISSMADNEKITITIYGEKQKESYKRVSVKLEEKTCIDYIYEEDENLNENIIVRYPKGELKSEGYLIKYENGKRVSNVKIRTDNYSEIKGIMKIPKPSS